MSPALTEAAQRMAVAARAFEDAYHADGATLLWALTAAIEAVEPLIRADERGQVAKLALDKAAVHKARGGPVWELAGGSLEAFADQLIGGT